jgi:hypothetical protein
MTAEFPRRRRSSRRPYRFALSQRRKIPKACAPSATPSDEYQPDLIPNFSFCASGMPMAFVYHVLPREVQISSFGTASSRGIKIYNNRAGVYPLRRSPIKNLSLNDKSNHAQPNYLLDFLLKLR